MKISRRSFIKGSAVLGTALAAGTSIKVFASDKNNGIPDYISGAPNYDTLDTSKDVKIIYSVCLQCRSDCTIRGKVKDGQILKLDGSPYSIMTMPEPVPYETDPKDVVDIRGKLCARGQAGIQTAYDPMRVKQPLKRVGPRGSGKWKAISWDQAFNEIVNGGDLFNEGKVEGFKGVFDPATPIDPNAPELGPKSNQFTFLAGRIEDGRKQFAKRFVQNAFGSVNLYEHTSICELSHHIAYLQTTPGKNHFKPDFINAHYIIMFGGSLSEANFPMNNLAYKLGAFKENGGKLVDVEPRFSVTASKADVWLPVKPGGDGALALGMIRWIIENNRFDKRFLENPSKTAANADGEYSWSDATYLVNLQTRKFLRPLEAGINGGPQDFVVLNGGVPQLNTAIDRGDLEGSVTVNGIQCKTSFTLLKEEAMKRSMQEYAKISGISEQQISKTAEEFTSYGKAAVADFYRGPVKHTNGFYNGRAIIMLNVLIGNIDWKGGLTAGGGTLHEMGGVPNTKYDIVNMHPSKVKASGVPLSREGKKYEDSTEFKKNGYPAKRPWFPFSNDMYQEVIAGLADGYPYKTKILFLHMGTPAYAAPGIKEIVISTLKDTKKVPLFIACDILIGETSMYADYILPDVTYLEQWDTPHTAPTIVTKITKVRQPMTKVFPETKSLEEILISIAKKMNLSGFGDNGFGPGMPLNKPEDFYSKLIANIAIEGGVPGDTEQAKIKYVLDRGGVFESPDKAYQGAYLAHRYENIARIYSEEVGSSKHSITGENFSGVPTYEPIKDLKGNVINDKEYPFTLITHKLPFHSHSRTVTNPWLMEILPENFVDLNADDANKLGIKNGDLVRIVSATNQKGEVGKARLLQGIRPGVVAVSGHYGHWALGAQDTVIDGKTIKGDKMRQGGINPNPVMRLDTSIGNVCLEDPVGGSASFNDTQIKVLKA